MPGKMDNSDRVADEEEFNQGIILPPLIIQLKKILDQYPDDTQILKELVQNAEDAGAKEVRFLYDRNTYGQDARFLHHPDLASYQGPALYAYNDGIFSEEDWKGIRMLSQSVKQKDPFKIGYFGMGFKSVFHLTDLPGMLSGDKIGIIDPHQQIFSASSHCWNISKRSDLLNTFPHQLEPYLGVFGCDANSFRTGFFKGTLFRFPLRQKVSPLSNVLYSSEKIQYLLQNFEHDAHLLLIFVKNLERISVFDREKHSKSNRLLFKAEISEECIDEVRRKRAEFYNQVSNGEWQEKPVVATYQMVIQTESWTDKVANKRTYRFLVTNYYCGGNVSPVFKNLFKDPELGFLPWVGTAMRLDVKDTLDGTDVYRLNDEDGRIFTFLPLPSEQHSSTGLPVFVHGFFALEQNRKYIKWPGSHRYLDIHMDKGLLWNQCMLREALPRCYVSMVMEAIRLHSLTGKITVTSIYRAFPDLSKIERKWEPIMSLVYIEILKYPVVFHNSPGVQEWVEPKNAIFNTLDPTEEATAVIVEVLAASSVKIVNIPEHVLQAIRKYCHFSLGSITATIVAGACKDVQYSSSLHWEHKMKLLRYFLKQTKYELLDGLQLLPLANGGFDLFHFNPKKADRPIYIAPSEEMQSLLPGLKDDFLESDIDEDIKGMLMKAASRGYTQLKVLDPGLVGKLLPRCLPQQWMNMPRVDWNPHEYGHPPENWLESLWLFLVRSSPRDLASVDGLPILPARTIKKTSSNKTEEPQTVTELIPLSLSNVALVRAMDGVTLSVDVEEIVQAIGIPVINELPDYVKSHPIITKMYVFAPTYMGVLKAIERRCAAEGRDTIVRRMNDMTTPQQKRSLRALFSKISLYEIQRDCLEMLSQLPIFETVAASGGSDSHFISVAKTNVAAPPETVPFPVSRLLIDTSSSDSQVLGKLLGVKQLNMAQLLSQIVFPDVEQAFYDNAEVQRIMLYVLKHYHFFLDIDKGFRKTLKSLAFLPKGDMLLTPDRFYDPDNELLQRIFLFEENFAGTSYSDPAIISVLRDVGLRGIEDVEPEDLQESAYTIQHMYSNDKNTAPVEKLVEKSNALLEYLHRHKSRLKAVCSGTTLAAALTNIRWVKAMTTKPGNYPQQLAWYQQSVGHVFYKPLEMAVKQSINLVGSVMPIVAADAYVDVCQAFGWDQPLPLDRVVSHLANVIPAYNSKDKMAFMEMARSIFAELVKQEIPIVAQLLSTRVPPEWLWHGDGFTRPENVVTIEPFMDLRPIVYGLPAEMQPFADFLENFGVKHSCDLMEVLRLFKRKYEEVDAVQPGASSVGFTRSVSKTVKRSPSFSEAEVKRDLHIYVCLLNELKSRLDEAGIEEIRDQIYIPVHSENLTTIRLAPLSVCTYTDDESIRQGYSTNDLSSLLDEKITLVHANVPNSTSEALGVPTIMSKMLEAEELDYSFGQTDSLTNRLNTLLEEYTDGFAIPKELIQNADDAGATVVKFLYDERRNQDAMTCLIDEGMRECQGPALWVYNNAVFSDEDFENITKLNGATKESQTDKIGRFGLGFNAVYNITDVPSFVSRHNIVIFDPHTTHLGKSIRNKLKPGLKLDMRRHRRKLQSLGNQFKPFNELFGCDISKQESYPSTLFRLPLRTKAQALKSEICQKHYDDAEVKELLGMLVRGAENLLLFTQNVVNVSVHHLPRNASPSEIAELFSVEKRPIKIIRELGPPVLELSKPAKALNEEMQKFIRQCQFLRAASDVMKQVRKGAAPDRIKFPDSSMLLCTDSDLTAKGEGLLGIAKQRKVQPWFICSCMGRGESLKMAQQEDSLVPASGIAVQVQYIPESKAYKVCPLLDPIDETMPYGAVFSYLPLPVRSGLPVHINGSFSVAANRRYLSEQNEDDKFDPRAIWNAALMRDAVCSAYLRMLNDLASLSSPQDEFSLLWPHPDNVTVVCASLLKSFYQALNDPSSHSLNLFSDGRRWGTLPQTVFLDCGYERSDLIGASLSVSRQIVAAGTNRIVVCLPFWVRRALEMSDADRILESRTYNELQFFNKVFLPKIDAINREDRDLLMLDALARDSQELNKLIKEYPCIPTSPDGTQLCPPTKLVDPTSALAKLFAPVDAKFPFGETTYASTRILQVLRGLGMKQKARDLSWEEILDRAKLLKNKTDPAAAEELSRVLLEVMNEKLTENTSTGGLRQFQQQLLELPLIPAMKKPRHFPLHWKGSDDRKSFLLRPSELYPPESKDLVGCVLYIAEDCVFPKESSDLLNFLRLGMEWKEPSVGQVLAQLDVISNPDTENYLHDQEVANAIQKMCYSILTFLQEKCTNDSQRQAMRDALGSRYCILAHNRFLSPKQLAFNFSYNCAPYLYEIPELYKRHFSDLLGAVGVKETFDVRDFVFALQSLHDIFKEEVLDKESLKVALQLVNLLNERMAEVGQTTQEVVNKFGPIYIPDARNVLASATELCFNEPDAQWVPKTASDYAGFSHPLIPYTISKQLGVNTRRQEVLSKHSRGIPFGQKEPLTNRIKRILSGYPCDKEILKELLQNADDAGATEVCFIIDPRQHGTDRVFDQSWRSLQGPALCVYNNKPFTEADLRGIQSLGQGSKSVDPNKTGQYGVGFNCVYHLTDAPSFLTRGKEIGETLCIFDPHAKYVPGATILEPGRRYDDVSQLRKIFTDVFPCYLEDKFPLDNGTMFRFPLRDEKMTTESELSDQVVTVETLRLLFDKFKQEIFDCLLFLNSVNSITLTQIDARTNKLAGSYTVRVGMSEDDRLARTEFSQYLKSLAERMQSEKPKVTDIHTKELSYVVEISDNCGYSEKWMIAQRVGVDSIVKLPASVNDAIRSGELALLPRGGVAAFLSAEDSVSIRRPSKAFCFLPLPVKTDLPVHINGHFCLDHEARRSLWQDDDSGTKTEWNNMLLRHVIAPTYISILRRAPSQLSSSMLSGNVSVMDSLGDEIPDLETYCSLFPHLTRHTGPGYWKTLMEAIYKRMDANQEIVLPVVRSSFDQMSLSLSNASLTNQTEVEWHSTGIDRTSKPYFDNLKETYRETEEHRHSTPVSPSTRRRRSRSNLKKPSHEILRQVLLRSGFRLVRLPMAIFDSFAAAGIEVGCVAPKAVIDFYASHKSKSTTCLLPSLPADVSTTPFWDESTLKVVLEYCSQDIPHFRSNLNGLPLLLSEDGQLRQFSNREKVYLSRHSELLPGLGSLFIHRTLVGSVFMDADTESCDVFRRFDVKAFAGVLSNVLSANYNSTSGLGRVKWSIDGESDSVPNERWLISVWTFLYDEFERMAEQQPNAVENHLAKTLLQPLRDWCLLPALTFKPSRTSTRLSVSSPRTWSTSDEPFGDRYLVAVRMADTVLDYSQASIMSNSLRHCLGRLGVLELDCGLLDGNVSKRIPGKPVAQPCGSHLARLIVSTPEKPRAMLTALDHIVGKSSQGRNSSLNSEECYTILKYFSDASDGWEGDKDIKKALRDLPLHLTIHDSLEGLGNNSVFLLEDDLPKTEMDAIQQKAAVVFLRANQALSRFYSILDCSPIEATEVYLSYIFSNFDHLSPNGRLVHLQFLKDYKLSQLRGEERSVFVTGLSKLRFLPGADGRLHQATEFCDPSHPVFKVMYKDDPKAFPPQPFSDFGWLDFLRHVGLQKDMSVELLIKFAKQIAESGRTEPTDDTYHQARTLITHLFKIKNLPTIDLLEQLVDIPFVPSCKISSMSYKIFNAFGATTTYITFKEGVPVNHEVLVWSSCFLLPDWANPYQLTEHDVVYDYPTDSPFHGLENYRCEVGRLLKVEDSPPVDLVVEHMQNICSLPISKSEDSLELRNYMKMDVMNRIYKFLQQRLLDSGARDDIQKVLHRLADIPCIVSDLSQAFVKPKQVVINLYEEDQIYPYLHQAPTELGEFKKLFLHLGATLHATPEQYASVLESIYYETGREKLHPNEMRLAFKAVYGLFTTLRRHRHKDSLVHVHNLFLPTKMGYLFKSTDIIFNDEPAYTDRIGSLRRPFLVDLAECRLTAANYEEVVKLLPHRLRPAMLSAVVQEQMEEKSRNSVMLHTTADKLRYQINSKPFSQGLIRLVKNEHRRSGHKVRQTILDTIEQNLKKIHVYGVDKVITFLEYDSERLPGSESECECFVDKKFDEDTGAEVWSIFINKTTCLNEELQVAVAEGINTMSGGLLKNSIHYIQPILSCLPHSIPKVLDRLKVRPDNHHGSDSSQPTLPSPGTFIPTEDHHLLKEDFEEFETGEYVGFELDDDESGMPTVIYAVIVEKIMEENFDQTKKMSESDQFAHRKLTQRYRINVGEERPPSIASATDLYKFHRIEGFAPRISVSEPYSPGTGPKKSPKAGYRESFYSRSSVFEPEEGLPTSPKGKRQSRFSSSTRGSTQHAFSEDNLFADTSQKKKGFREESEDKDFVTTRRGGSQRPDDFNERQEFETEDSGYNAGSFQGQEQEFQAGNNQRQFYREEPGEQQGQQPDDAFEQPDEETITTEKVMEEVSDTLEEAWKLPEGQRKKIIKRLLLKWHPDKNIGNEAFSTVITQHIQAELERLELGLPRPSHFDPSQFDFDPRNPFAGSTSFQANFANAYKFFFDQMNQRAKEHKQQRERYQENYTRDYNGEYNFGVPPTFSSANPQPAQAKRFLRQAQEDLRAADNDYDSHEPAFEWVCFKAHQASEKALKAAQFAVDAVTSFSHDLVTLAASLDDVELRRLAQKLQKIVGNSNKLYNPDPIDFVVIPHEEYTKEMACDSVMCAVDILERVKEFVELRDYN